MIKKFTIYTIIHIIPFQFMEDFCVILAHHALIGEIARAK